MRFFICISTFCSLCLGSARASDQSYGLDSAPPFAAYLNGKFPTLSPNSVATLTTTVAFPNLSLNDLMFLTPYPRSNYLAVVTKSGRIYRFENNANVTNAGLQTILDISSQVYNYSDSGMTGLVFHPEFGQLSSPNRGYIYVTYKWRPSPAGSVDADYGYIRLSRFTVPDGQTAADPNSEQILLQNFDRQPWHDAGTLIFGADGYLYFSIGDEGGGNDEYNVAQQINARLHSGIFRIDVDLVSARSHAIRRQPLAHPDLPAGWPASYTANYNIPNDNPFVNPDGRVLEEYYAHGLRNPYRFSQDPVTEKIWIGDVGQSTREEIDILQAGANYGWAFREGTVAGSQARPASIIGTLKEPIWDYGRDQGGCAIGGYVYRGHEFAAELTGKYIFTDWVSHRIFALTTNGETFEHVEDLGSVPGPRSCGLDANGEIYFLTETQIFKLSHHTNREPEPPALLSQTGAFTNLATLTPSTGFIPYDVNSPFWSDNAAKKRWMAVPNDGTPDTPQERITFSPNSEWQFPSGTVFVKHFELPIDDTNPAITQRLETRFLVIDRDGGSYGVTYRWRADGSDADLLTTHTTRASQDYTIATAGGGTRSQTWSFPSRLDCTSCHNSNSKHVLGAKTYQLNRDLMYPVTGRTDNQLRTLAHVGLLSGGLFSEAQISDYPRSRGLNETDASLEIRARSYLDSNCSHCHRPGGVRASFDARFTTSLALQNLIHGMPEAAINGPSDRYIRPRDLTHSLIYERANRVGPLQMPPLSKSVVDTAAMQVLAAWINSVGGAVSVSKNSFKTFASTDFPFSNVDSGVTLGEIKLVTELPTHGTLRLNGTRVTSIPSAPILRASIGTLTYTPDVGYVGPDSFKFQVRDAEDFSVDAVMTIDVTSHIPVLNRSFEITNTDDSKWISADGAWMHIPSPWIANTANYGRIKHDSIGLNACPEGDTWIANMNDAGYGVLTQDLKTSVNAGTTLSVTFHICKDEYGPGVLEASFMVGENAYSQIFDTSSLAVNTWRSYTLTQTVGVSGHLSLRFKNLSGRAGWLDNISDVSLMPFSGGSTPTIIASALSSALTTTYGTASNPANFMVAGINMTTGILVTAPTGFEVSQAFDSGYAPSAIVEGSGTNEATRVYVRLAATTPVGSYNSQYIVLTSSGAMPVNVSTTVSGNTVLGLSGLGQPILSGSTTPVFNNGTDYGNVTHGRMLSRVFTLFNPGSQPVSLSGNPLVEVDGDHASDFKISVLPDSVVPAGGSVAFEIRFAPTEFGARTARVKLASAGVTNSPITFAVQGFGSLPAPRAQTLTFAPPATVYLSQSPLQLIATSSSGLPVTLQVISGPATLDQNGLLNLASAGTVRVVARQAGNGSFAAAPALLRTITVKADPTTLTLVNLIKTYNGQGQEVGIVGAKAADVVVTYRIGTSYSQELPVNVGQYPVKVVAGSVTKTGTLIINPAPLYVNVENKRRLVGEDNPALTVLFEGFIGANNLSLLSKSINLSTTATKTSSAGSYAITSTGGVVTRNHKLVHRPGTLVVEGVAGSYEALLRNPVSGLPNGHLALTVPAASRTFTASLRLGQESAAIAYSGNLTLSAQSRLATATLSKTVSGVAYELKVVLSMFGELNVEVKRAEVLVAGANDGIRLLSLPTGQKSAQEGSYTAILEPALPAGQAVPMGVGWATVKIDATGKMSLTGKLADGSAITAGLAADVAGRPGYRLFVQPYASLRKGSYVAGSFTLMPHPRFAGKSYLAGSNLTWVKAEQLKDLGYRSGFGPVTSTLKIDPWQAPTTTNRLAARLELGMDGRWQLEHSQMGSFLHASLPTLVGVSATNVVSVLTPLPNTRKWKMTLTPTTGAYSGSFEVLDLMKVKVHFSGVLRQTPTLTDDLIGAGHYLLPALKAAPSNEQTSGAVFFWRPE